MSFVGLHIHSDYSLLDGASQLPDLVDRAIELNMPAVALTDHGVMCGAVELLKLTRGKPIKPIIGNEMYVINGDITDKKKRYPRYHQVVLAKNTQGYKNLVKLTTISHLEGMQGRGIFQRPCINKELLEKHHEGLIVTSACLGGELPQAIMQGRPEIARKVAQWYQDLFGEDYYIELQDHGSREDRLVNVELVKIARELDIEIILTNDSHFISCNDVEAHDALLCIQTGKSVTEDKRLRYSGTEYLKSCDEMRRICRDHLTDDVIEEAIANTIKVANKIEAYDILGKTNLPDYPVPPGHTPETYFEDVAWNGLLDRLQLTSRDRIPAEYDARMRKELKIMQDKGFAAYFLVVWDFIRFSREQNIPVGPGRGSAAGSLVAYSMRITNIDPVKYGLLFERFLNPERKSMPDIDTDFCIERRDEVIQYVTEKYGQDKVAQIITFNRMTSKAVLKDVARVMDIPYGDADKMAKMIPVARGKPAKLKTMIGENTPEPEFREKYLNDPVVTKWLDMAMRIEGTNKTSGVHAAGVVISKLPLDEIVPLQRNNDGSVITQYYMEDVEACGLLKMDFLGLRNLTMIQRAVDLIEKTKGEKLDIDLIPEGDLNTYKLLEKGELEGIFQLESSGMKQVVRDLKPSNLEDISSVLALYRPGPLDTGMIPEFIDRKHGRKQITYGHEILQPILHDTYGTILYQEQIMRIAQDMAGYSLGQADLLRRAMGKKKVAEMEKHREKFLDGAARNGVPGSVAKGLFEQMLVFAEYCFNKSHSTAYGFVTYQTAYLKANYPVEYMAALLSSIGGDRDKVQRYIAYCLSLGIEIEPPDVNRSGLDFTPLEKSILFGLGGVKNIGQGAIENLIEERENNGPYQSLSDLCDRVDGRAVNRRALEALIHVGAFDKLNHNRKQLIADLDVVLDWASSRAKDRTIGQASLFDLMGGSTDNSGTSDSFDAPTAPHTQDYPQDERLRLEKELLGFYVSDHPLKDVQRPSRILAPINLGDLADYSDKIDISAIALIANLKPVTTKKGDRMAILQLEDLTGSCEAVVFPKTHALIHDRLIPDTRVMLWGKVDKRDDRKQLIVNDIEPLEQVQMVMVKLEADRASDIAVQHQLAEILREQAGDRESRGRIPVVAEVCAGDRRRLVRFGNQFLVKDAIATVEKLNAHRFEAKRQLLLAT
ncbi:DNA polymerase III subunit alpha [Synechococcus sp. PCC 7336]|uniref:DNA polymerase III subunit alpha n=1 Tax=Synechococcus sp. PCC 7336 TaxID=195250 RepID=UPI00034A9359|nr:DNA polymerase III subunit alpha [Synechococcus sp. PCC 7336]